eukprot:TRINITY_DN4410_c0_g1_i1.p1 TRINITY_DN4410_c0_g1~~TRINITY_DN4410_c0_g1_i1.p1  ORF type:complete len:157 (-),score=36.94 TRINITY_DN4410_c0_g1_i1:310-780(-)
MMKLLLATIIVFLVVLSSYNPGTSGDQIKIAVELAKAKEANMLLMETEEKQWNEIKTLRAALEKSTTENALLMEKNIKQLQLINQQQQLLRVQSVQSEDNSLLVQSLYNEIEELSQKLNISEQPPKTKMENNENNSDSTQNESSDGIFFVFIKYCW